MRSIALVAVFGLAAPAFAAKPAATQPFDSGLAGLAQRAHLRGKALKAEHQLPGGGLIKRTDIYTNKDGQLELKLTTLDGKRANGTKVGIVKLYQPALEKRAYVHEFLYALDKVTTGGSILPAETFGAKVRDVGGRVAALSKLVMTLGLHANASVHIAKYLDGSSFKETKVELRDGSISQRNGRDMKIVDDEGRTTSMPSPAIYRTR